MVRLRFFACFVLLCVNFACLPKRRAHAAAFAAVAREAASFAVLHATPASFTSRTVTFHAAVSSFGVKSASFAAYAYTAKFRCIALYTDTHCVTALHSYTATQRYTALYIIQLYSAIHYTTSTTPLWGLALVGWPPLGRCARTAGRCELDILILLE